ncbi:hypothetical protein [Ruegeria sp. EL01]|jgi:hypothetical protein|uniref:hypothetical protein n=1 Tax=Ruegeria sp. EL01 TaxID=2107578 RepID=UPI000EA82C61|nr:hypothetical protein [Ruegeria sp. EL01]
MFVDSADQNYVVARWCFQMNLATDFLWNAVHCLEKLMKAVLLFNGKSSKGGGHDLSVLYPKVLNITGNLLPDMLIKPNEIEVPWRVESAETFLGRLYQDGQADNRYHVFGYVLHREDLYKLDRMVYAIRRLCCPLDSYLFGNTRNGQPDVTFREQLERQPDYMPRMVGSRLQKLIDEKSPAELRRAALNHNFLFAPDGFEHGETRYGVSSQNPVLGRRIVAQDEQNVSGDTARETADLTDWVLENIQLPKDVRRQFEEIRSRLRGRS